MTPPPSHGRLYTLGHALRAHGVETNLGDTALTVIGPTREDPNPRFSDSITCRPREDDGGRLWFFDGDEEPIAEADHVIDAAVAIGGRLAGLRASEAQR